MPGSTLKGTFPGESYKRRDKNARKCSLKGDRLNDVALNADGSVPSPACVVPSEVAVANRVREASVGVLVVRERAVANLAIESSVREIRPSNQGMM